MSRPRKLHGAIALLGALAALGAGTGALAQASGPAGNEAAETANAPAANAHAQVHHAGRACTHPNLGVDAASPVRRAAHAAERACRCALLERRARLGRRVGPRALARCSAAPESDIRRSAGAHRSTGRNRPGAAGRQPAATRRRQRGERRRLRAERRRLRAEHRAARTRRHHPAQHTRTRRRSTAADGSGCDGSTLVPSESNVALVGSATLCLINRERSRAGEAPLQADADLAQAAQGHSLSMLAGGYFEHVDPDGRGPLQRVRASGYIPRSSSGYEIGENIAWGSFSLATPASIVAAWMASPGHRANILRPDYRDTGIGIVAQLPAAFGAGSSGAIYTQDFGAVVGG